MGSIAIGLVGLCAAVALGKALPAGPAQFDTAYQAVVSAAYPTWAAAGFDLLASLPVVAAILALIAIMSWARGSRGLALSAIVGGLVEIPTEAIKLIVDRPRPPGAATEALGSIAGYPSGHTARAVVVAGLVVLAVLQARQRRDLLARAVGLVGVVAVVVLVGLARIASGDHWPTDVVGGAILGAAWLGVATIGPPLIGNPPPNQRSSSISTSRSSKE